MHQRKSQALLKGRQNREKGQALTEFIFVLPLILILLVGVIELGNGYNAYVTVIDSARDGARLGSRGSASDDAIRNLVLKDTERLANTVSVGDVIIQRDTVSGSSSIKVEVCYNHSLIFGLPLLPDPISICSDTTMPTLDT